MRELYHPAENQLDLATILNALGDPVRLHLLKTIASKHEATCSGCGCLMPKSALSHHFKVLRESGLINVRIEGNQRFLSIRSEDLNHRFPGLIDTVLMNI